MTTCDRGGTRHDADKRTNPRHKSHDTDGAFRSGFFHPFLIAGEPRSPSEFFEEGRMTSSPRTASRTTSEDTVRPRWGAAPRALSQSGEYRRPSLTARYL